MGTKQYNVQNTANEHSTAKPTFFFGAMMETYKQLNTTEIFFSVRSLYTKIINDKIQDTNIKKYSAIHHQIFSKEIREFNYKFELDLIATADKKQIRYARIEDFKDKCVFCNTYRETQLHLFYTCAKIKPLWTKINDQLNIKLKRNINIINLKAVIEFELNPNIPITRTEKNKIIYTIGIMRHTIWVERNDISYKRKQKGPMEGILRRLDRRIKSRIRIEEERYDDRYVETIRQLIH